ncbi:histidine triad (HIT) family protein [Murinocardiopsis flavida]|uniref:Histidine triad (HIT) family protein n=1 Tax=Murinocardiopsis flavida TaxID=645275 RepID=A0A2P8DDU1_9ACTN|nr:HIT domain-containing protein [Murinocardiopsis flavida]PSK95390.1 histidine triad (HIT) family protein [Murinocardiopsis flavida]
MQKCVFCKIVQNTAEARIVYRSESAVAFLPLNPATPGHTLVVPVDHFADFLSAPPHLVQDLAYDCHLVAHAILGTLEPEGMNLITSAGTAATQSIFHLHYHLVPRWESDRMRNFWPQGGAIDDLAQRRVQRSIQRELEYRTRTPVSARLKQQKVP